MDRKRGLRINHFFGPPPAADSNGQIYVCFCGFALPQDRGVCQQHRMWKLKELLWGGDATRLIVFYFTFRVSYANKQNFIAFHLLHIISRGRYFRCFFKKRQLRIRLCKFMCQKCFSPPSHPTPRFFGSKNFIKPKAIFLPARKCDFVGERRKSHTAIPPMRGKQKKTKHRMNTHQIRKKIVFETPACPAYILCFPGLAPAPPFHS